MCTITVQVCRSVSGLGAARNGEQGVKNSYHRPWVWAGNSSAAARAWSGFGHWSSSSSGLWLGCPQWRCQHLVTGDLRLKIACFLYFDLVGWPSGPAPWNLAFDCEREKYILFHSSFNPFLFSIVWKLKIMCKKYHWYESVSYTLLFSLNIFHLWMELIWCNCFLIEALALAVYHTVQNNLVKEIKNNK